jgi:hypothetical protein
VIERMTNPRAANWVDRGEEPEAVMLRLLEFYLPRGCGIAPEKLHQHVIAIRGMAEGDATEYQVAGYVALVEREAGMSEPNQRSRRTLSIALWHVAKCAEIRERALRLMAFGIRPDPARRGRNDSTRGA